MSKLRMPARTGRVDEVHLDYLKAKLVADLYRVRVVLEAYTFLPFVAGEDEPVDDEILEGFTALDSDGDDVETDWGSISS